MVGTNTLGKVAGRMKDAEDVWDFEGTGIVGEAAKSSVYIKLRKARRACEEDCKVVSLSVVEVIALDQGALGLECKNKKWANCNLAMKKELRKVYTAECATC